jgi:hypothetical protein
MQLLLNVGGPDRVSRVQMAEAVAQFRGYDTSFIKPVSASSVSAMLNQGFKLFVFSFNVILVKPFYLSFDVNMSSLLTQYHLSSRLSLIVLYCDALKFFIIFQVDRGVKSPADISMDITRLVQTLNINPVSFKDGVKLTLTTEAKR